MSADKWSDVRAALAGFQAQVDKREQFKAANYDDDVGEPSCGYPKWDERMFDFALDIAEGGEHLAEVVAKALAVGGES